MRRTVMLIAISCAAVGCSSSDTNAPTIKAKAAHSCNEINQATAYGDTGLASRLMQQSLKQLDAEYGDDTSIQSFYREYIKKVASYQFQFLTKVRDRCLASSDSGVANVMTEALNDFYSEIAEKPRLAMCSSYNEGVVSYDEIINELNSPKELVIGGTMTPQLLDLLANDEQYGPNFVPDVFTAYCGDNPRKALWSAFNGTVERSYLQMKERDSQIAEERATRLKAELLEEDYRLYGIALSGDNLTCEKLRKQSELSQEGGKYQESFERALFLSSAQILSEPEFQALPTHKQKAARSLLERRGGRALASAILNACSSASGANNDGKAIVVLNRIPEVSAAKSEAHLYLERLTRDKQGKNSCPDGVNYFCRADDDIKLANRALSHLMDCERGAVEVEGTCFVAGDDYFRLALLELQVSRRVARTEEIKRLIDNPAMEDKNFKAKIDREMEPCIKKAVKNLDKSFSFSEYVKQNCEPNGIQAYLKPYKEDLSGLEAEIEVLNAKIQGLRSLATANVN